MSLRDVADIEERLKVPVLGVIPHNRDPMGPDRDEPEAAEPYRVLHTNLNLAMKPGQGSVLVVFSAGPAEGKSTTICRLAHMMGAYGERVLLVDGDLRRPAQHRLANCPRSPGLSDVLADKCDVDSAIRKSVALGLDLLDERRYAGIHAQPPLCQPAARPSLRPCAESMTGYSWICPLSLASAMRASWRR